MPISMLAYTLFLEVLLPESTVSSYFSERGEGFIINGNTFCRRSKFQYLKTHISQNKY